jgi:hypothetical protein
MSIPPEGFLEDFERMQTHFDWAHRNMTSGNVDIPQAKLVIEEWQEFIAKWLHRIKEEEVVAGIKAADKIMQELHRALERLQLEHLQIVLAARRDWHVAELVFKGIVACSEIVKVTPPHLLPELLKILSDGVGKEFDAAKEYRECETNAEQAEAKYRRELTRYECDWPERTDEAMRNRLLNLSADDFKASDEELAKVLGQQ